jgi:flagellar biosynthesis GTPase FlhF
MWKTAMLYAEKPAPLMNAEQMLLEKLSKQNPQKLQALGLTRRFIDSRKSNANETYSVKRKKIRKAEQAKLEDNAMKEAVADSVKKSAVVVHDDLSASEDEYEVKPAIEEKEQHPQEQPQPSQKQLEQQQEQQEQQKQPELSPIAKLFETARIEFEAGDFSAVHFLLGKIIKEVGITPASASDENESTEESIEQAIAKYGLDLHKSERFLISYIKRLGGDIDEVMRPENSALAG